jgi:hypothetical protein
MFGLGRRKDAQAVEAMREQLAAADMHARSVLAAVAQTDSRWSRDREERARAQLATAGALEEVRNSAADNTADITRALHHVADMCGEVVERLDADRTERRALTDAINLLVRQQQASPLETPSQVLGGTVIASAEPPVDASRNGDAPAEISLNGNGNGNGNGAYADEIRLADYEDAPAPAAPFGTIDAYRPAEPYRGVEVIDIVEAERIAEPAAPAQKVSTWDAVPPPRRSEPAAFAPPAVEPPPIVDVAPIVEPPSSYDAFAGLPLLQPAEPVRAFEPAPFAAPAAAQPQQEVSQQVVSPAGPDATNGIERQWNDSHRLTESNTFRPSGGTRLTPRRSTTQSSTR